jgi:hypothetical protein
MKFDRTTRLNVLLFSLYYHKRAAKMHSKEVVSDFVNLKADNINF